MNRVLTKIKEKLYTKQTGYILNYLTLQVSDPVISRSVTEYQENHLIRFRYPTLLGGVVQLLLNTLLYFV